MDQNFDNTEVAFKYRSDTDLKRARFLFSFMASPLLTNVGIGAIRLSMATHLPIKWLLKKTIFKQFCGGETLEETAVISQKIGRYRVHTILDYGVEGKESDKEFDKAVPEFVKAIRYAASQNNTPFISLKITGFSRYALLEKINSGLALTKEEEAEWQRVYKRIDEICGTAAKNGIMVLIDAEETWIVNPCNDLTEAMMEKYNKNKVIVFNTYQMYCHGTLPFLKESIAQAAAKKYLLGAKLVRGAYMEKEKEHAIAMGYPDPIQPDKKSTDRDYDDGVQLCLQNIDKLALFIGTHNERSCMNGIMLMMQYGISPNDERVYFSQLFGMSDHISFNMASQRYNVAKYVPYGPVKDVVPYLVRRAQENTSVAGQTNRELSLINKEVERRKI